MKYFLQKEYDFIEVSWQAKDCVSTILVTVKLPAQTVIIKKEVGTDSNIDEGKQYKKSIMGHQ